MDGNYLLFGGSGFIGYHTANFITETKRSNAIIFDIKKPRSESYMFENVDVRCDINIDYQASKEDVIFNLAAVHRTPGHFSNEYFETNILGAENICNYARKFNINTIVFTSSIATYGTYEKQKNEKTIATPNIPYGISKLNAEYIHKLWQKEDPENRRLIILRPGVVFGQYENGNFTRLINAISRRRFFYPGRKDTKKACIYVKDMVELMIQMLENESAGVNTYNLTYEPSPRVETICDFISEQGKLTKPNLVISPRILLLVAKFAFGIFKIRGLHPDRVKKLMISNNISGEKVNKKYKVSYGLEHGIKDWMETTKFRKEIF